MRFLSDLYVFWFVDRFFFLQFRAFFFFLKKQENLSLCQMNFVMIGQWSGTEKHREGAWIAWIMESYEERARFFIHCSTQRPLEQMENSRLCLILDEVVEFLWFVKDAGRFTLWLVHYSCSYVSYMHAGEEGHKKTPKISTFQCDHQTGGSV